MHSCNSRNSNSSGGCGANSGTKRRNGCGEDWEKMKLQGNSISRKQSNGGRMGDKEEYSTARNNQSTTKVIKGWARKSIEN